MMSSFRDIFRCCRGVEVLVWSCWETTILVGDLKYLFSESAVDGGWLDLCYFCLDGACSLAQSIV